MISTSAGYPLKQYPVRFGCISFCRTVCMVIPRLRYGNSVDNAVKENSGIFSLI